MLKHLAADRHCPFEVSRPEWYRFASEINAPVLADADGLRRVQGSYKGMMKGWVLSTTTKDVELGQKSACSSSGAT
jgi:hypothetical protein